MKKNKGFTLIELLAVIVLLGLLLGITTVAVGKIKEKQDEKNYQNVLSSILTAAKVYISEHPEKLNFDSSCIDLGGSEEEVIEAGAENANKVACTTTVDGKEVVAIAVKKLIELKFLTIYASDEEYNDLIYFKNPSFSKHDSVFYDLRSVHVKRCVGSDKLMYSLSDLRSGSTKEYNDCGCESQEYNENSETLCTE